MDREFLDSRITERARRCPGKTAIRCEDQSVTYLDLEKRSNRVANFMYGKIAKIHNVIIILDRSPRLIESIIGLLKCGLVFVPLDPLFPPNRVKKMIDETRAEWVITDAKNYETFKEILFGDLKIVVIDGESSGFDSFDNVFYLDHRLESDGLTFERVFNKNCYIYFTSGSTGIPKGVLGRRRGLAHFIQWEIDEFGVDEHFNVSQMTPPSFDPFLRDIFLPLMAGGTSCIPSKNTLMNMRQLIRWIEKNDITLIHTVPSLFKRLVSEIEDGNCFPNLKYILLAGELLRGRDIYKFIEIFKDDIQLVNVYGPTETTLAKLFYRIQPGDVNRAIIPVGKPINGAQVLILDSKKQKCRRGKKGEVYIRTPFISSGYYNDPQLTEKLFIKNPYGTHPNDIIYKTGDLGRLLPDGNIELSGRVDFQVKIRGVRIELGEIENRLLMHKNIREAVVTAKDEKNGDIYLCAYVVPGPGKKPEVSLLREYLSNDLPDYMIPSYFVFLEKIPLTFNGKLDRTMLPGPKETGINLEIDYLAPRNVMERKIAETWKEVLKLEKIGVNNNFFDMGGNSLKAMEISSQLSNAFEKEIPVAKLFEHTTISSLAHYLNELNKPGKRPIQEMAGSGRANKTFKEIAVIGVSCRFPGAENIEEFWNLLEEGKETISFFSDEELLNAGVEPDLLNDPNFVKIASTIPKKAFFDASFFGYTPEEAELLDPQIRIFHELSWEALEDSGIVPELYDGLIGVYAGAGQNLEWEARASLSGKSSSFGAFAASKLTGIRYLCTRLSYNLNLKGPSITMQTACSTSLVAIHMACQALLNGECDAAIAGGVTASPGSSLGYLYEEGMILAPDGHCRAFDAKGKGTVFGEGVGVVLLKPLEEAIADGHNIYAVIKGSAINNDGNRKVGFTAPSVGGQVDVIRAAFHIAGIEPGSIGYIETHGTGTAVGDPIEVEALKQVFNTKKKKFCKIGSVKSNFGHLDAAAGIAGFIKTILALKNRRIPPSLHFETPNPGINLDDSPFEVNTQLTEWKREKYPLRAGISSLGMGGTNAHVIVEEAPGIDDSSKSRTFQMLLLSAKTGPALNQVTQNLALHLKKHPDISLADVAYTLQVGRKAFKYRRMLVCPDGKQAVEEFCSHDSRKVHTFSTKEEKKPVIFMFSGAGSQYINMGAELYREEPLFREEVDRCFEILNNLLDYDLKKILYPDISVNGVNDPHLSHDINNLEISQLVTFTFEYALAKLLIEWGIKPAAMIGYSLGEYTAACISGVFSPGDALKLVAFRVQLIRELPPGLMLSVPLTANELEPLLKRNNELSFAVDNGPSCIVAGSKEAVERFEKQMKKERVLCVKVRTSAAGHSKMMEPILKKYENIVRQVRLNKPQIPYISNVTGNWMTGNDAVEPAYWVRHMQETVRFADGIKALAKTPGPVFVEIGPGHDLDALVRRYIENIPGLKAIHLVRHPDQKISDIYFLLNRISRLWLWGVKIDWEKFYTREKRRRISLPTYPFERQRYWIEGDPFKIDAKRLEENAIMSRNPDMADWFYLPSWKRTRASIDKSMEVSAPCRWLLFSDHYGLSSQLVEKIKKKKHDVITVKVGKEFQGENDSEFFINPRKGHENGYEALFDELIRTNRIPDKIVHLWNITPVDNHCEELEIEHVDTTQNLGFYSLLNIAQALGRKNPGKKVEITVVTNNMQEVTGNDGLCPGKAAVLGPVKSIPIEYANMTCRSIDVALSKAGSCMEKKIVNQLFSELTGELFDPVVAYRRYHRWVQTFEPTRLGKSIGKHPRLRQEGVYLVIGGLGGIGLLLAEYLVKTVRAKLVLTGRSAFPSKEEWHRWLTGDNKDDRVGEKIRRVKALEESGAGILVLRADVTDIKQMQRVIHKTLEQFGQVNGVIHCAGVPDAELIQRKTPGTTGKILAPKVRGTLVLDSILKDIKPDFFVLFSSLSSIRVRIGQVGHCAANNFLDAFARYKFFNEGSFTVSINWERWQKVGTAAVAENIHKKLTGEDLAGGITPEEGVEIFSRILADDLPQVAVSTHDPGYMIEPFFTGTIETSVPGEKSEEPEISRTKSQRPDLENEYIPPRDEIEQKIARTWEQFFGFEPIGIDDDFFELGGDSLKALIIMSKIHKGLDVELAVNEFLKKPFIRNLAFVIRDKTRQKQQLFNLFGDITAPAVKLKDGINTAEIDRNLKAYVEQPLVLLNEDTLTQKKLFCFPPALAHGMAYKAISTEVKGCSFYSFNFIEDEDRLRKYVEIITGCQPVGPYILFEYSAGAQLTFEVAKALENNGYEVSDIILMDSFWPRENRDVEVRESVTKNIEKYLEDVGVGFLKEKILGRVKKYRRYFTNRERLDVVNANVHLILSEENKDTPKARCWDQFTTKTARTYQGFGSHDEMPDPGHVEKNAEIIREIVDKSEAN